MADDSEIPHTMTELAEQQLARSHAAFDQLSAYLNNAIGAWMGAVPPSHLTAGLQAVRDRAMKIAKENASSAFTLGGKIVNAKTPQEVLTLQMQFAQGRMNTLLEETPDSAG